MKREDLFRTKIETERLLLRPITGEDDREIFLNFTPRVTRFMYPASSDDIEVTRRFIAHSLKAMTEGKDLQLVITEKMTGAFVGCAGLHGLEKRTPELGIWIKEASFGLGLGREAIRGLYDWASHHLHPRAFLYPVDKRNGPSRKIPLSLGGRAVSEEICLTPDGRTLELVNYLIPPSLKNKTGAHPF